MMQRLARGTVEQLHFYFEGRRMQALYGDSVAAALLANDRFDFRDTSVSGGARGPYCMMGVCFECLLEIDGVANCQGCMVQVRHGMRIRRQHGAMDTLSGSGRD